MCKHSKGTPHTLATASQIILELMYLWSGGRSIPFKLIDDAQRIFLAAAGHICATNTDGVIHLDDQESTAVIVAHVLNRRLLERPEIRAMVDQRLTYQCEIYHFRERRTQRIDKYEVCRNWYSTPTNLS